MAAALPSTTSVPNVKRPITDENGKTRIAMPITKKDKDGNSPKFKSNVCAHKRNAEMSILRTIQQGHYLEKYEALNNDENIYHRSKLYKLRPLWHETKTELSE